MSQRCYGCMHLKDDDSPCAYCGASEEVLNEPNQLPVGTVLRDQYLVGKVLGQGGFGITYLGLDQNLNMPIAIKEYFPTGFVNRDVVHSLAVTCTTKTDQFQKGRSRFLREAQTLAKLRNIPEIVGIYSFFEENNTAYIIMEYVEGTTLRQYTQFRGGKLLTAETFEIFDPILQALDKVHKAGLVHRDISPDNIMLQKDGGIKILDFGTARDTEANSSSPSTEVVLKYGFAPLEQYQRNGKLGPWTDIYALCATIHYCLTGLIPPDSVLRLQGEEDVQWDSIPGLSPARLEALRKGMEPFSRNRFQSVEELYDALFHGQGKAVKSGPASAHKSGVKPQAPDATKIRTKKRPAKKTRVRPESAPPAQPKKAAPKNSRRVKPLVVLAAIAAVAAVVLLAWPRPSDAGNKTDPSEAVQVAAAKDDAPVTETVAAEVPVAVPSDSFIPAQTSISAGEAHTAGLKADGTVVFAGPNNYDNSWTDIAAISAGPHDTVGLKQDGTVVAVGTNAVGGCNVDGWTDIIAVDAGASGTVGLKSNGTVIAAGRNTSGQFDIDSWTNIVAVSSGAHTVGLKADGTVVAAGSNDYGQCDVSGWTDIVAVSASDRYHTVGVKADGTVVAAGRNDSGQCNVDSWTDIVAISTGAAHTVGLKADGTVVAVGDNFADMCAVEDWTDIVAVAAGLSHTVGLKADGTVVATGRNGRGQCNVADWSGIRTSESSPKTAQSSQAAASSFVPAQTSISAGESHTVGLKADGTVLTAGDNAYNKCDISNWKDITAVSAGRYHTVGLKSNGTVVAKGCNDMGQCNVQGWIDIVAVSSKWNHTVGLRIDGTVIAVGNNDYGQCDVDNWTGIAAVDTGGFHTVGLKSDGSVVFLGFDDFGQRDVERWTDIVAISTSEMFHTVGLKSDGTVVAAGRNTSSECEVAGWSDIVAVSAGDSHTIGLKSDGTVVAAGNNFSGQCDIQSWTDIVAVAAGRSYTVGLKSDGTLVTAGNNYYGQCDVDDWAGIQTSSPAAPAAGPATDKDGFTLVEPAGQNVLSVLGYKNSFGGTLTNFECTTSTTMDGFTHIRYSWNQIPEEIAETMIATWSSRDFTEAQIQAAIKNNVSVWKKETAIYYGGPRVNFNQGFPVVVGEDCYVLLLHLDKDINAIGHTVLILGYPD